MHIKIQDGRITNSSSRYFSDSIEVEDSLYSEYLSSGKNINDEGELFEGERFFKFKIDKKVKNLKKEVNVLNNLESKRRNIGKMNKIHLEDRVDNLISESHTRLSQLESEALLLGVTQEEIDDIIINN